MTCPNCKSDEMKIKAASGFERIMILLTGKRRYRCRSCEHSFRAPDRRSIRRTNPAADPARKPGLHN